MNGQNAFMNSSVGLTTHSAVALGPFEGDGLRRQLAEHDVERRDDGERERDGDGVRGGLRPSAPAGTSSAGSTSEASAGSPIQPRPMLAIVMPSCVAAM